MIFPSLIKDLDDVDTIYTEEELLSVSQDKVPHHIAILPDGNRRWAKERSKGIAEGYRQGSDTLVTIIRAAKELGIKVLTVYGFSTENWKRPKIEVDVLMEIFEQYLREYQQKFLKLSIRFNVIGNLNFLPSSLLKVVQETKEITKDCSEFDLVVGLNYGSRDEICRAIRKIVHDCVENTLSINSLTEEVISHYLDTSQFKDPDLLIRTSGERRISNFLLWQSSYTEIYTEEDAWPNFTPQHLLRAVLDFQNRDRRRGGDTTIQKF